MKPLTTIAVIALAGLLHTSVAAPVGAQGRTITDIKVIPARVLQRTISPKFYETLLVSPIQGWVTVRGQLAGTRLAGLKIVHSELNGQYDALALKLAKDVRMAGAYSLDRANTKPSVLLHLLIYQIADGTMALSFAQLDEPGGDQMQYYGCAKLAVLKNDGKWVDIKGPDSLEGKGMAVRQGSRNSLEASLKVERLTTGAEATNFGGGR